MRCNGQCGSTRRLMVGGLAIAMAFGAFIWLKLRLVTDVPRTAYAEPKETSTGKAAAETPAGSTPGPESGPADNPGGPDRPLPGGR